MIVRPASLVVLLSLSATVGFAQTLTKESLNEKLAAATCDCLQQKAAAQGQKNLSKETARSIVIQCSGISVGKELKNVQQVYGANALANKALMNQMGQEMGVVLVQTCPTFMTYSMAMVGEGNATPATATTTGQTTGQWRALTGTGVAILNITVDKTQNAEFVWSHHFPQDDELLGQLEKLNGRSVRVSWQEVEVLQPDTKQYRKLREVTGVELL
ncbi:hypothetical protein [Hymenobacter negativus]|uniref:Uncharacterized protein n=1 Tax=Hymenobacter negativus TaxID=2795026 RepID=A0ABS0QB64_9BACT|nr:MULTISPECIES: hypothetical protein [Bacteria]MBH8559936.1 hypothetical protein [Hymenobacter negativus]MBH8570643.1 hypothetical protein [Hymenobacter negativus]MBR7210381.1 hypothetical protein [Microvirga sp. STS02]